MSFFEGKNILIGISGGISSYKIPFLVRLLIKENANVKIVMTPSSERFVTKLTLSTLSKNPVYSDVVNINDEWNNHVEFSQWADIFIIAPATLNTLGKISNGICDNLLLSCYFSSKSNNVFLCPAMDLDMYMHPVTENNLRKISEFGNYIIPVEKGELASGLHGEGRMAEPENIIEFIKNNYTHKK